MGKEYNGWLGSVLAMVCLVSCSGQGRHHDSTISRISQIQVNCPVGCKCVKNSITCLNGNLNNTDLLLQISDTFYPELDTLVISGNNFKEIEATNLFGPNVKHQRLTKLSLASNHIKTLHAKAFNALEHLEELDLSDNEIGLVQGDLLGKMPLLKKLSLRRALNPALDDRDRAHLLHKLLLERREESRRLSMLEELDISGNAFVYLAHDLFCALPALRVIRLQDNVLRDFSASNSSCLVALEELDLSNNGISFLGPHFGPLMDKLTHLRSLNLSENPFNCDCHLQPFIDWFKASEAEDSEDEGVVKGARGTRCLDANPPSYITSSLLDVPSSALLCPDTGSSYLHSVYIVLALACIALLALLVGLFHGQRKLVCPRGSPLKKGAFSFHKGYRQLQRETDVQAEFV